MRFISTCVGIVVAMLAFTTSGASADALSVEEIVQQLLPPTRTRSYDPQRGITVQGTEHPEEQPTINLYINFDYDSDELKQDGMIVLDRLAVALRDDRLAKFDFLIGGHTDAVGSDAYNQVLSERRAATVREYLQMRHAISADRLIAKGFGETRLLDPNSPFDGTNRRVQITTLSIPEQ